MILAVVCGSPCKQNAPVNAKGSSPRVDRLLSAEEEVLTVGGNVVRLAGLYISFYTNIYTSRISRPCKIWPYFLYFEVISDCNCSTSIF
jgi:hypothetical protein